MEGAIACCLRDLVIERFGREKWEESLLSAGLPTTRTSVGTLNSDDEFTVKLVDSVCRILGLSQEQAADAFGDYWVNVYSQNYKKHANSKSLIVAVDNVQVDATETKANSPPPRSQFELSRDRKLIMHYQSRRGLVDFLVGLAQGVGNHYQAKLEVAKLGPDAVEIVFN